MDSKFLGILFACGIAFLTLNALDSVGAQIQQFQSFDDFLADIQNKAHSLVEYVTQIQALVCPNQPTCGPEGELTRQEVLETLPEAVTVNGRQVRLDDISEYAGICCLPCSCSDRCHQDGNCCPTKQLITDYNDTAMAERTCVVASIHSYKKTDFNQFYNKHRHEMFRMTTDCFQDGHDETNIMLQDAKNATLPENCRTPKTGSFGSDIVPVTSLKTRINYWNRACAECNGDNDDVIEWSPIISLKRSVPYFMNSTTPGVFPTSLEDFLRLVTSPRFGDIVYQPPEGIPIAEISACVRKEAIVNPNICENSSEWLSQSCLRLQNPVFWTPSASVANDVSFSNIFCLICQKRLQLQSEKSKCRYESEGRGPPDTLTALLDYRQKPEESGKKKGESGKKKDRCGCTEILDPYQVGISLELLQNALFIELMLNVPVNSVGHVGMLPPFYGTCTQNEDVFRRSCRSTYCPYGDFRAGCGCIQAFKNYSGLPILIKVKISAKTNNSNEMNAGQLRKLHTALVGAIKAIAEHSSAEVLATFREENVTGQNYLSILILRSDPGHDTKTTMLPLMKFIDTGNRVEVNIRKLGLFSAHLTSSVALWTEVDPTSRQWKFVAQDMKMTHNSFQQIYDTPLTVEMWRGIYQTLSRLLYCTQVQLNGTEYSEKSGLVVVNVTRSTFSISDYYKIPPAQTQVRICADEYLQAYKETGKTSGTQAFRTYLWFGILVHVLAVQCVHF